MDRDQLRGMAPEALTEALSDRLDELDEEDFDLAEIDAYLDVLDEEDPVASEFDPAASCRAFMEKHGALFQEKEVYQGPVLLERKRRPRGRRIASRAAALAAAMILVSAAVATAMGVDIFGFFGRWGRGEFWFPGDQLQAAGPGGTRPPLEDGTYRTLQAALDENGITLALAPQWVPEPCDAFGKLKESAVVSREAQSSLFEADYRDSEGRGYTISLTRSDHANATGNAFSFGAKGAVQYVCDGESYYIASRPDGTVWVTWAREDWSGEIEGDLDVETAMALCASITQGKGYVPPSQNYAPLGNDLINMVEVSGLDPNLAPTWLPEGFVKTDIQSHYGGIDGEAYAVQATFDDTAAQRKLTFHVEWWEDPAQPPEPVFAGEADAPEKTWPHNGVDFLIRGEGEKTLVHWLSGHVSGYLYGDISVDEAKQIVDSIPQWSDVLPEKDTSNFHHGDVERKRYDTLEEALADNGFDSGIMPTWLPEGYELTHCETTDLNAWFDVYAAYMKGEDLLNFHLSRYTEVESAGSTTYIKDDEPVVEYEHNGLVYYIMTNNEFRNIVWKYEDLEGSIGGPFTLEEAKQIVDSIGFRPAAG